MDAKTMMGTCWMPCGNHVGVLGAALWIVIILIGARILAMWFGRDL